MEMLHDAASPPPQKKQKKTRMHFSMMRTARLLTLSRSVRSDGGGRGSAQLPRMQISLHGCRPPSPWMQTPPPPGCRPPCEQND